MWGKWEDVKSEYESKVNDPWDWVTHFENAIARYTGAKHAIACDSNSNAIRLMLHYLDYPGQIKKQGLDSEYKHQIPIPKNTYASVVNQIILSGCTPVFEHKEWYRHYRLGNTPIIDAAVSLYRDMYINNNTGLIDDEEAIMILSFHHRKILNIGQGGIILTNSDVINDWARPMIYDGRSKYIKYDTDILKCVGWHMYMTPEQAKKGLEILHSERIDEKNSQLEGSYKDYTDLSNQPIYRNLTKKKNNNIEFNYNDDLILNTVNIKNTDFTIYDFLFNLEILRTTTFIEDDWKNTFDELDLHSLPTKINFVLFDDKEHYDLWETNPIIDFILKYFESAGISDRLKFYGNNILYTPNKKMNYEGIPFFIGDTCQLSPNLNIKKNFDKHFICAQSFPKIHRISIFKFLNETNILEKCYWSWNPNNIHIDSSLLNAFNFLNNSKGLSDVNPIEDIPLTVSQMHDIPSEFYKSFCCIVTESHFYSKKSSDIFNPDGYKSPFITEKTEKCFTIGIPFVMISTKGTLKQLKELGFKTFDKWWDESYDDIEDDTKRLAETKKLIESISEKSIEDCYKIYNEMIPVLKHNQLKNIELNKINKKVKRTRDSYLNFTKIPDVSYEYKNII